jgi:hypothetical protein
MDCHIKDRLIRQWPKLASARRAGTVPVLNSCNDAFTSLYHLCAGEYGLYMACQRVVQRCLCPYPVVLLEGRRPVMSGCTLRLAKKTACWERSPSPGGVHRRRAAGAPSGVASGSASRTSLERRTLAKACSRRAVHGLARRAQSMHGARKVAMQRLHGRRALTTMRTFQRLAVT